MSQNKELKHNMVELQDAFVKLSNQNMELASELDTERRRVAYLKAQLATPTPVVETTPIPVVDVESVSIQPSHVGSNLVEAASAPEASPTVLPSAMVISSAQATPIEGEGEAADGGKSEHEVERKEEMEVRECCMDRVFFFFLG